MYVSEWTYSTTTTAIASVGILINLIVIVPNFWRVRSLTPSSLLIVCLCCSDSLLLSNYLALAATHLRRGDFEYNAVVCQIQGFFITFCALWSLGLCTGLTLFRYKIIIRKTSVSHQFAYTYLLGTAAFCALVAGLPFICNAGDRIYIMHQTQINCTVAWFNTDVTTRVVSWICLSVLMIPVSSIGVVYVRIYSEVSKVFGAYRASSVMMNEDLTGNNIRESKTVDQDGKHPEGHRPFSISVCPVKVANDTNITSENGSKISITEKDQRQPKVDKKKARTEEEAKQVALLMQSIAIVGLFLIGWTPYLSMGVYELLTGTKAHPDYEFVAEMFVSMNDLLNPVVVMVFDDKIRRNVLQVFNCAER
ncbi:hypothetical protein BJ741DRAFT_714431 [Chytriomyces cf. hyalinus JEL632]|nr:hypothetical protein BJ741DRAFT_714431 [Chytriomyces cf. hyalinus JEL632]